MIGNYLKTTWRHIRRYRGTSLINVTGLAVGMACFTLILLYVNYESSFEDHNPAAQRVYRIYVEHQKPEQVYRTSHTPVPLVEALQEEIPEIEDYTRYDTLPRMVVQYADEKYMERGLVAVDPGVFDILGFRMIAGDKETALQEKHTATVTEDIARKYFGSIDVVGKTLILDNSIPLVVQGVIRNHPPTTGFAPDILVSMETLKEISPKYFENWLSQVLQSFIRVPERHSVEVLENKIAGVFEKYRARENDLRIFKLEKLKRIHLYSIFGDQRIQSIRIFLGVGVLILIFACINFMNLATARSARRAREVGMRKVAGAKPGQLISQFLGESFFYTILAMILALLLCALLLPVLQKITGQLLVFGQVLETPIPVVLLITLLGVGLLSGSYPAFFLSSLRPVGVFRGSAVTGKKGTGFRRILVVFQFTISIILIILTFTIVRQINFMSGKSLGFTQSQILVIRNPARKSIQPFKKMLTGYPGIISATGSYMLPHSIGMYNTVTWEGANNGESIAIIHNTVDYDYLKTFEIPLVAGRDFSREFATDIRDGSRGYDNAGAVIINQTAAERFGWKNPVGRKVIQTYGESRIYYTVIGVVRDFHFSSLRNTIRPLKIFLHPDAANTYISIRVRPENMTRALDDIREAWKQFNPGYPLEYFFYDSVFDQQYREEQALRRLFEYFSVLAIFIAALGLFGLASHATEQRTKEIGLRKILGATSQGLVLLLTRRFARWVVAANLIAWPLAYYAITRWLEGYAYHTSPRFITFIGSGLLVLIIAMLTVSGHSLKAAVKNPVESLRYE